MRGCPRSPQPPRGVVFFRSPGMFCAYLGVEFSVDGGGDGGGVSLGGGGGGGSLPIREHSVRRGDHFNRVNILLHASERSGGGGEGRHPRTHSGGGENREEHRRQCEHYLHLVIHCASRVFFSSARDTPVVRPVVSPLVLLGSAESLDARKGAFHVFFDDDEDAPYPKKQKTSSAKEKSNNFCN